MVNKGYFAGSRNIKRRVRSYIECNKANGSHLLTSIYTFFFYNVLEKALKWRFGFYNKEAIIPRRLHKNQLGCTPFTTYPINKPNYC